MRVTVRLVWKGRNISPQLGRGQTKVGRSGGEETQNWGNATGGDLLAVR